MTGRKRSARDWARELVISWGSKEKVLGDVWSGDVVMGVSRTALMTLCIAFGLPLSFIKSSYL